jgi:DNA repair protein RAD57
VGNPVRNEILSLRHQQRFFTGWGDTQQPITPTVYPFRPPTLKTPALGLVWSTQIACRIALKKHERSFDISKEEFILPYRKHNPSEERNDETSKPPANTSMEAGRPNSPPVIDASQEQINKRTWAKTMPMPSPSQATVHQVQRTMKLVFAPWLAERPVGGRSEVQSEMEIEIWKGGMRAISNNHSDM